MFLSALQSLCIIGAYGTFFAGMDTVMTRWGLRKPYYAVHVIHNAIMVALTTGDVWTSVTDYPRVFTYPTNWHAVLLCYALHFYHTFMYWRTFHPDDWLHHITMIGVALPLGSLVNAGTLMGMNLFFTTGLPGGISYALLFAERNGWVTRSTEKAINEPVHEWIRSPGCLAHATLAAVTAWSSVNQPLWARLSCTLIAALTAWNGIYFAGQVMRSNRQEGGRVGARSTAPVHTAVSLQ